MDCKDRDALLLGILVAALVLLVLVYRLGSAAGAKECRPRAEKEPAAPVKTRQAAQRRRA